MCRVRNRRNEPPTSSSSREPTTAAIRANSQASGTTCHVQQGTALAVLIDEFGQHARETALKERWNEAAPEVEALLHRDRYRRLHELLTSGRVEIRVVPTDHVFVHGKAGVIE